MRKLLNQHQLVPSLVFELYLAFQNNHDAFLEQVSFRLMIYQVVKLHLFNSLNESLLHLKI
jgi:hypothetical protein